MCNIALVKITKSRQFLLKPTIIYQKFIYLIQNVQVPMQNYYFKFLNMCKFAHDRKTHLFNMLNYILRFCK